MKIAILLASISSFSSIAAEYKVTYLVNGKETNVSDALLRSMRGEEVLKCQSVEAKPSKSGTSIGLRSVKKPKSE